MSPLADTYDHHESLREDVAAYALGALSKKEERLVEAHLDRCADCRLDLASFSGALESLVHSEPAPAPPAALRERILTRAREEQTPGVPWPERLAVFFSPRAWLAGGSLAAATCALLLFVASSDSPSVHPLLGEAVAVSHTLEGDGHGRLLVGESGGAVLITTLPKVPAGQVYEAWVIHAGTPRPAGLFTGGSEGTLKLSRVVPRGALVAVTVEPAGGVNVPTGEPVLSMTA